MTVAIGLGIVKDNELEFTIARQKQRILAMRARLTPQSHYAVRPVDFGHIQYRIRRGVSTWRISFGQISQVLDLQTERLIHQVCLSISTRQGVGIGDQVVHLSQHSRRDFLSGFVWAEQAINLVNDFLDLLKDGICACRPSAIILRR
jgi:hypothetical protein